MPKFFTPVRLELFKHVFSEMDVNNGGTLDLNEVTPLLQYMCYRHLRVQLTADEVEALVLFFDVDDSSDLCFGELLMILRYLIKARNQGKLKAIMTKDAQVERRSTKRVEINGELHEFDAGSDHFTSQPNSRGGSFDAGGIDPFDPLASAPRIRTPLQRQPSRMSSRDEYGTKAISDEFLAWQREHMEVAIGLGDGSSEPSSPVANNDSSEKSSDAFIESSTGVASGTGNGNEISGETSGSGNDVVAFSLGATGNSQPEVSTTEERTLHDGGKNESKIADETFDKDRRGAGSSSSSRSRSSSNDSGTTSPAGVHSPKQQPTLFTRSRSRSGGSSKQGSRSDSMDEPPLLAIDLNSDGTEKEAQQVSDEPVTVASVAMLEDEVAKLRAQLRQVVGPSLHERSHSIAAAALPYADATELAAVVDSKLSGPFRHTYATSPTSAGFLPRFDAAHQHKKYGSPVENSTTHRRKESSMSEDSVSVL
jgi:Ca2+-binding EF-hand superfamily protein